MNARKTISRTLALALAGALGSIGWTGASVAADTVNVSTWTHGAPLQDAVVASQPSLKKMVGADINWLQITSGPAALAGLKSGSYNIINGIGNPPVVAAIAKDIDLTVVWAMFYDNAGIVMDPKLKTPKDMEGKTFGTLQGSSEDFAFQGWLKSKGLEGKVKLVGLERQAMVAAFKTGAISGGINSQPGLGKMIDDGGKLLAPIDEIAKLGYPALDVIAVGKEYAAAHPDIVQGYVCAIYEASKMMRGKTKDDVMRTAAGFVGMDPEEGVKVAGSWPIWDPEKELTQSGLGEPGHIADGQIAQAYLKTGKWLKSQGKIDNPPTMDAIVSRIDTSYAQKALSGGCDKM